MTIPGIPIESNMPAISLDSIYIKHGWYLNTIPRYTSGQAFSVSAPYPEVGPPHAQVVQVRDSAPPTWQVDFARAKKFVHVFGWKKNQDHLRHVSKSRNWAGAHWDILITKRFWSIFLGKTEKKQTFGLQEKKPCSHGGLARIFMQIEWRSEKTP